LAGYASGVQIQVEGAIVMALGAAVKPGITFQDGKCMQHNFYDNPLIRIHEVPEVEVLILTEGGKVKGGENPDCRLLRRRWQMPFSRRRETGSVKCLLI
jgi:hypothetical protein